MLRIVNSIKRQECLVKSEFHAGMEFQSGIPKESSFVNPPNR